MALMANREVDRYVDQELRSFGVTTGVHVFKGAFVEVGENGYLRPATSAGVFAGLAYDEADNTGGADGDASVRVYTYGDFGLALAGAAVADIGRRVYATDDETLTFSAAGATPVGYVQGVPASGWIVLRIEPGCRSAVERIEHKSASFAPSARQSGTTFTNLGATGAVVVTLPQNPPAGTSLHFVCMADQAMQIDPGAAGGIYIKGAKQADNKYAAIADIGDFMHLVADGNGDWVAVASIGGADADITIES